MKCLLNVNSMQKTVTIIILLCSIYSFSQKTTIKGSIKDQQNRSIQSASVSIIDDNDNNLGYNYSDEDGSYSILFEKPIIKPNQYFLLQN